MERNMPFGFATQALSSLGAPDLIDVTDEHPREPSAAYFRVLKWLDRPARAPVLLLLDDLQWADADSLALFAFLARRLRSLRVAFVATVRPWPREAAIAAHALHDAGQGELIQLAALGEASVRAMLGGKLGLDVADSAARDTWELCRGNPLLVEQVVHALKRGERVPRIAATADDVGEQLLLARFAGVEREALACAEAGAVLGTTFVPELAADVAGLDDAAVDAAFDALHRSGLVVPSDGNAVRFAHPLFAQALHDNLAPALRRRFHARAFQILAARHEVARGAEHALRAELVGNPAAIAALERSGRSALVAGAVTAATRHLGAAVRFSCDHAETGLLASFAQAAVATGQVEDAVNALESRLAMGDLAALDRVTLLEALGRALFVLGLHDRGTAALVEAVALATA